MKKYAAHYIYLKEGADPEKLSYFILDENDVFVSSGPLLQETEAISFYNGILFLVNKKNDLPPSTILSRLQSLQQKYPGLPVFRILDLSGYMAKDLQLPVSVYHLDKLDLFSPEFGTNNGGSCGYIERL